MAFFTKPVSPVKGQRNLVSLDKNELALDVFVSNDTYFSDQNNWKYVTVNYKTTTGNQRERVIFEVSKSGNISNSSFEVSTKARNIWEVENVTILDFDKGDFILDRSQLVTSDFDIDFSVINVEGSIVPLNLNRDFSNPNSLEVNELLTDNIANGSSLTYGVNQIEYSLTGTGSLAFAKYRRDFDTDGKNLEVGANYTVEIDIVGFNAAFLEPGDRIVINLGGNTGVILYNNIVDGTNSPISNITVNNVLNNRVDLDFSPQSGIIGKEVSFAISAIRITKV